MVTPITQPVTTPAIPVRRFHEDSLTTPEKRVAGRLISLDAYRGFIMLLLVSEGFGFGVLKSHPGWAWLAAQADHAPGRAAPSGT